MNCLELKAVMDAVGIESYGMRSFSYTKGNEYAFEDIILYSSDYEYTIVRGAIPSAFANAIYNKYPDNQYCIRGNGDYEKPEDWTHNGFISGFNIGTKEGVLIFIEEMRDYKLRQLGMPATEVQKYDEQIAQVNSNIISSFKGSYSARDWIKQTKFKNDYNKVVRQDKKKQVWTWFRSLLDEFDMAVNPFLDENFELDEANNYSKKVRIGACSCLDTWREPIHAFAITELSSISNEKKPTFAMYRLDRNGFTFKLECTLPNKKSFVVTHFFYRDLNEIVSIDYNIGPKEKRYELYLRDKKVEMPKEGKRDVTIDDFGFFADELGKAIKIAKEITVENMSKKEKVLVK